MAQRKSVGKKPVKERKRVGKTGTSTAQAKTSRRAGAGTEQARQAGRNRLLREICALAVAAVKALDADDLDTVRANLESIAARSDK